MRVTKDTVSGNSKIVTLGDPKNYSNAKSALEVNSQLKPEKPGGSEPSR